MKCTQCGTERNDAMDACPSCGAFEPEVAAVRRGDLIAGRYRVDERVGRGGMGTVYRAFDTVLSRDVAVKILQHEHLADEEARARFTSEATVLAQLDHPNIVGIVDAGVHGGRPFLVMKWIAGQTVYDVVRASGPLPLARTLQVLASVGEGLDYLHQRQLIHRDVKSSNILLGEDGRVVLIDFGVYRKRDAAVGLTKLGQVVGTPHYMAPEQALGARDVDHRADLYALAVVAFEALSGTFPFTADSELRVLHMQAHDPPPNVADRVPGLPREVAAVVQRGLAKRPGDRYASAREFVAALRLAGDSAQVVSPRASAPATALGWRRAVADTSQGGDAAVDTPAARDTAVPGGGRDRIEVPPTSSGSSSGRWWVAALFTIPALLVTAVVFFVKWQVPVEALRPPPTAGLATTADAATQASDGDALAASIAQLGAVDAAVDAGTFVIEIAGAPVVSNASSDGGATATREFVDERAVLVDAGTVGSFDRADRSFHLRRTGKLTVVSKVGGEPVWAEVTVDGAAIGRTPLTIEVRPGRHRLIIERSGFARTKREVWVVPGKVAVVLVELRK